KLVGSVENNRFGHRSFSDLGMVLDIRTISDAREVGVRVSCLLAGPLVVRSTDEPLRPVQHLSLFQLLAIGDGPDGRTAGVAKQVGVSVLAQELSTQHSSSAVQNPP